MANEIKQRTVYKLIRTDKPEDGTDVYVGSTSQTLRARLLRHRADAKTKNSKICKRMLAIGVKNWQIVPLVICFCIQGEIRTFERKWVELLNPDLNTYFPADADNKWNHIEKKEYKKRYYRDSLETKKYYCEVCDKAFGFISNLKIHFNSNKHKDKNFKQLIEGVHKMIKDGTFSEALKETTL